MVKGLPVEFFASGCDALDARLGLGRVKTHLIYSIGQAGNVTCAIISSYLEDWIQCLILLLCKGVSNVWILLHFMTVTAHHKVSAITLMVSAQF